MSKCCVMCGSSLPDSHQHSSCSMCYGDIDYGTDGYYREWMETDDRAQEDRAAAERQEEEVESE